MNQKNYIDHLIYIDNFNLFSDSNLLHNISLLQNIFKNIGIKMNILKSKSNTNIEFLGNPNPNVKYLEFFENKFNKLMMKTI